MKKIFSLLSAAALLSLSIAAVQAGEIFGDVNSSTYYQKGIEYLQSEGIINGYPDGTYKPDQTLNRAEMVKIIAEGAKTYYNWAPEVFQAYADDTCFSDVPANEWYTGYLCYGKDQGWVIGYSDGTFRPTQTINFVEGLKITFKGFGIPYSENKATWYREAVESAGDKNYIPPTISDFNQGFKRGEMADMVARIIKDNDDSLLAYLGDRVTLNATYDTIEAKLDLSQMTMEELMMGDHSATDGEPEPEVAGAPEGEPEAEPAAQTHTVTRTADGFDPATITIKAGDTVKFVNNNTSAMWPASDVHPSHTQYPGSGISKCTGDEADSIFDACGPVGQGENYEFIFTKTGSWDYHDHLSASKGGRVTVE